MYYLYGGKCFIGSVYALVAGRHPEISDESQLRSAYLEFSRSVGGDCVAPSEHDERYCFDPDRIEKLIGKFTEKSRLTDIVADVQKTPEEARVAAMRRVTDGIARINAIDPDLHDVFNFAIHTLFYHRSNESSGGSVSSSPGVIWCGPRTNWSDDDMAEFLVHELAHNMLFIDERRYQHYIDFDEIAKPENYAISAVLNKPRPLDKVLHSLVVAHELLSFREAMGDNEGHGRVAHPETKRLFSSYLDSLESVRDLLARKDLVSDRAKEIVESLSRSPTVQ